MSAGLSHSFHVVSADEHVPAARRETRNVLAAWGVDAEVAATACLIVTELVTNVVRHAARYSPTARVVLRADQGELTIAVADDHPFRPRALPAPHDSGGWGLALVKGLVEEAQGSHQVAADLDTGGKVIVIRLPLLPAPTAPAAPSAPPALAAVRTAVPQ
ncbi:ATP-binding protein [Kitasatospora sp. NPDC006697]|uniref:ATP-binding protein n=1 Tax=Kitasatospora sp. NPDC006697 TaxID=3364020 RepID=UPI0036C286B0